MELDQAAGRQAPVRFLGRFSSGRIATVGIQTLAVAVGVLLVWAVLQIPLDVPDASSPPVHNGVGTANDWTSVGQTFVVNRNGLNRVSVVLATDQRTRSAEVTFHVKDSPTGKPLRTVKHGVWDLPEGNPSRLRPGSLEEQWYSFDFEPILDSAGRKLYFSVEGKDIPRENTVKVLMFFHSGYPLGEAYMNEKSVDAHLVFRTHSRGRVIDLLAVIGENLTRTKPGLLGNQATYLGLAALYAILVAALLRAVGRMRT